MSGRRSRAEGEERGAMRRKKATEEVKEEGESAAVAADARYDTPVKANRVVVVRKKKTTRHEDSCPACAATGGKLRYPPGPLPDLPLRSRYTSPSYRHRQPPALLLPPLPDSATAAAPFPLPSPSHSHSGSISPKHRSRNPSPDHRTSNPLLLPHAHSSSSASSSLSSPPPPTSASPYNFSLSLDDPSSSRVRCHVDYLDRDFALDVDLHDPNPNWPSNIDPSAVAHDVRSSSDSSSRSSSRQPRHVKLDGPKKFSLHCYHPKEPDKNYKFHVELFKTSSKGYGLRVIQCPPKIKGGAAAAGASGSPSGNVSRGDNPPPSYAIDVRNFKANHSSSSSNSKGGGNSGMFVRPRDLADMDEVRISSGKLSSKGDDEEGRREDECRCVTPCGAAHCKAH